MKSIPKLTSLDGMESGMESTPSADILKEILETLKSMKETALFEKDIFNVEEVCTYTDIKKPTLYKLTSAREIPFYCPRGKFLYFRRKEIDSWLLQNRIKPINEIETESANRLACGRR